MEIRQLFNQGISISDISRLLNLDRKTVRKYVRKLEKPSYKARPNVVSLLDPYKDYLTERLRKYNLTTTRLF